MSIDLTFLVWAVLLTFAQMVVSGVGGILQVGLVRAAGNREDMPPTYQGWAGRATRAHRNMLENLVLFAILVLVAHISGKANDMTALGAQVFFYARLAFAAIYIAGIPWLRTAVFAASVFGMLLIAVQLLY